MLRFLEVVAIVSILVVEVTSATYLISTPQRVKTSNTPEWFRKMKGQQGVLLVVEPKDNGEERMISEKLKVFVTDNKFKQLVKGDHKLWEDDGGGNYGPSKEDESPINEQKGRHYYYGFFFSDKDKLGDCQSLKSLDDVVLYIGKNDLEKYKEISNLSKRAETDSKCGTAKYDVTGEFWVGKNSDLNSSNLEEVRKINVLQFPRSK